MKHKNNQTELWIGLTRHATVGSKTPSYFTAPESQIPAPAPFSRPPPQRQIVLAILKAGSFFGFSGEVHQAIWIFRMIPPGHHC